MKNLLFFLSVCFLVAIGCGKDAFTGKLGPEGQGTLVSRSSEQMVPLTGEIIEVGVGPNLCYGVPFFNHYDDISGNLTHLGNVTGGYGDLYDCRMAILDDVLYVMVDVDGIFQAANGDVVYYTGTLRVSTIDFSMSNALIVTGGTGRWENAEGTFTISGEPLPDDIIRLTVDGEITPPRNH